MSIENDLINISKDKAFEKEGFKSLFGLTIEVEKEIISYCKNLIYKKVKKDVQIFSCTPY